MTDTDKVMPDTVRSAARPKSVFRRFHRSIRALIGPSVENKTCETEFLAAQCIAFQQRRVYFIGPIMLIIALWILVVTHAWQLCVISGTLVLTNIAFARALWLARHHEIEKSMWLALFPVFLAVMSIVILVHGLGSAMLLIALSIANQASVFSRRMAVTGGGGIVLLFVVDQLLENFPIYNRARMEPEMTFGISVFIGAFMVIQILVYLRKHHDNSLATSRLHAALNERQNQIVSAVTNTMPFIENSVTRISGVSDEVAKRADSQVIAMDAMAANVKTIMASAHETTLSARRSDQISSVMQAEMHENVKRLSGVANEFEAALDNIHNTREIMGDLVANTDNIESILRYNRDIGEHIKMLSVNASIEAAGAGEYGAGFAVVARELREMIESTEENLIRTRRILDRIRIKSASGMQAIDSTAELLEKVFQELSHTRETLVKSADSARVASVQLREITNVAVIQQDELTGVSSKVDILLKSAFELASSSANLSEIVAQLDELKKGLARAL